MVEVMITAIAMKTRIPASNSDRSIANRASANVAIERVKAVRRHDNSVRS